MRKYFIILVLLFFFSCVPEDETDISTIFVNGGLNSVEILMYDNLYGIIPSIEVSRRFYLDADNQIVQFSTSTLGNGQASTSLQTDSIRIILNGDRFISSEIRNSPNPLFLSNYYTKEGDSFIKIFSQEDYDNAQPIN